MALTIATALTKGGVSKTTVAIALAEAATDAGPVVLIDTDAQGSAVRWSALAVEAGHPLTATVTGLASPDLARYVPALAQGAAALVVDTPPGDLQITRAAINCADVVVIPVLPRLADLDRIAATVAMVRAADVRAVAVLTMVRAGTLASIAARETLAGMGLATAVTELPMREAIAANYGRAPTGPLAAFGRELLYEITEVS